METKTSTELNKNQTLAIQMFSSGMSGKDVAKALNVTPETVSRWNQLPQFRSSLNEALNDIKLASGKRMVGLITSAVDAIEKGFNDPNILPRDRFIMGIKFLELCKKHEIEPKVTDMAADNDIRRVNELTLELIAKKENEYIQKCA